MIQFRLSTETGEPHKRNFQHSGVLRFTFAPNTGDLTYIAVDRSKQAVVHKDTPGEWFDKILRGPVFSPDGTRMAYVAELTEQSQRNKYLVVDSKKEGPFSTVELPVFSPDGKRVAFSGFKRGQPAALFVDGQIGAQIKGGAISSPVFSPDSSTIAFIATAGLRALRKSQVVVGETRGPEFDHIQGLVFSPDGSKVAYVAIRREGAKRHYSVVVGDVKGKEYDHVFQPTFGQDNNTVTYRASLGKDRQIIVEDGKEGPEFRQLRPHRPLVTPDGRVVYLATKKWGDERGEMWRLVVGDQLSESFHDIAWPPMVSPDGSSVAFGALRDGDIWWKVLTLK